ncbi:hypothetical protein RBH26_13555 [Natronolimnohabitans sp. A-GB9]|uniref:hypothetical protein n=1 Tax=Natronolimnohabitans sp. A-GB9 TaxID=3069757 RepID=UPI0027B48BCC|nr:hypothetical protein [Natronolimnohabitans sp. A-GB9]MDQ2051503.1 hypothetical protein [Natronolimnohabitans sp. A-GB9]
MMTRSEEVIARFTQWIRQRPNSIEFWELVLTDERLVWCYVGQSYRSMLLRANMGDRERDVVAESELAELEARDEHNFVAPIEDLERIRHVEGTRFRRARLELEWVDENGTRYDGQMTLVSTADADPQRELVAELDEDPRLEHVEIELESPRWSFL